MITGEGRAFCSGGDVEDIIGELFSRDMKGMLAFTRVTGALVENIRKVRRPDVAAVNGTAVGAGAVMGAAHLLPRVVGLGRASELLFSGDIILAAEAHRIGLVNRVVAPEQCVP